MTAVDFFSRWRVRLGYLVALIVLWLARPSPRSVLLGAAIGVFGLCIRAYAAGYLHKQAVLTTTGPYAHTRNPLYFGSSFLALGAAIAMHSFLAAALLLLYFAIVYSFVMRREEWELAQQHGATFAAYASAVPLFLPKLFVSSPANQEGSAFSWVLYKRNHEYQAALGFFLLLLVFLVIWRLRLR